MSLLRVLVLYTFSDSKRIERRKERRKKEKKKRKKSERVGGTVEN